MRKRARGKVFNSSPPIQKPLSHSRSRWTPDVTGRQLVLDEEDRSERNKDHQWC